ncbi:unnamed protein product [Haemonchus placei]|uniref:Uncharacterized protein n=1 Tax=Haemonchus placei TaxID=6290 RepID=A0A0N4VSQ8_HAEPC|nr:unnamed protein product [Haemonchus placei]
MFPSSISLQLIAAVLRQADELPRHFERSKLLIKNIQIDDLGGDPFADPMWIPTLDICKLDCDKATEYCVENEELKQQCKKMPEECIQLLHEKQMVDKFFDD